MIEKFWRVTDYAIYFLDGNNLTRIIVMFLSFLEQEFWLYDVYRLPRVIATTMDGVYVSIPRNYNQRFVIVNSTGES